MPEPRPERNPGETLSAYTERLQEWAAQQNAPAATKPGGGGPAPIPAGFVQGPTPGQILRTDGFAGMTLNPATGQYEADKYAPSAATLAAAGLSKGGGSGGTSFTPFPTSNQRRDAEQTALGATKTPPDTWYIHPAGARAVDTVSKAIYTRDSGTGNWTTNGQVYNPRGSDALWVTQAARDKVQGVGPASTPSTPSIASAMRPIDPLATPLNPNQGPTFNSPLFSQGFRAGAMPTFQEGMIRGGNAATNALNALTVQSRSMQGNGPVVQGAASMGNGRGNIEFTRGGQGTSRTVAADRQFDPISFYVPGSYNPQTSRDNDGVFRPVDVAYNIASPTLDPLAGGGLNTGGAAYMTLSGPQTAHINDMSTGFNPNAMAHSNIGLAYGRDFSGLDSVSQMVATAALMNDREQLAALGYGPLAAMDAMTAASPSTWEGDGPGFRGFARGGTVIALDPLGGTPRYANGGSMVTNEPIVGIGTISGKPRFIVGEDNADRDRLPDRERLTFRNGSMNVTPLDPPRRFAQGGTVYETAEPLPPEPVDPAVLAAYAMEERRAQLESDMAPWGMPLPGVGEMRDPSAYYPMQSPVQQGLVAEQVFGRADLPLLAQIMAESNVRPMSEEERQTIGAQGLAYTGTTFPEAENYRAIALEPTRSTPPGAPTTAMHEGLHYFYDFLPEDVRRAADAAAFSAMGQDRYETQGRLNDGSYDSHRFIDAVLGGGGRAADLGRMSPAVLDVLRGGPVMPYGGIPRFAEGGVVQARTPYINPQGVIQDFDAAIDFPDGPGDWTPYTAPTPTVTNPIAPTPVTNPVTPTPTATTPTALPIDPGGVNLNPTSPTAPLIDPLTGQSGFGADDPAGGFEGTPSPADEFIDPPATVPVGAPRPIDPLANFDVNNPNILAPWQKAAQDLAVMAHRRRTIDDPRRRAGGMGASTGLEVLQGDVPATGLPPGMFYDPSGQVTRVISDIIGSQDALRALGPEEDVSPAYEAVTSIGNALDDMARIRQLEDARVAATAEATAEQLYASNAALDLWGQLQDLGGLLEQMKQAMGPNSNPLQRPDPAEMQALQGRYNAMLNAYNSASLTAGTPLGDAQGNIRLATIDAQLASIRGRLPVGKNEASLRTDLAREQLKIAKNDKRIGLKQQVANLAKVGVPSLSAPIKPIDPLAA